MYPKFLLLPKCPKSKQVQKAPRCKQDTSYKPKSTASLYSQQPAPGRADVRVYKNAINILLQIYFSL